ncbi:MAG TPA: hypothetical protein VKA46_33670 [Gemmataceae bacterium]|nr:hypothetical protein [Gemmataceae bacterium]
MNVYTEAAPPPPPAQQVLPQMAPAQMVTGQQMMIMAPQFATSASAAQSVPVGRARPGITFDFFRLPIPYPRLIAVPTTPEVTTIPMAQSVVALQPQATAFALPMQAQAMVPVQAQAVMPVQAQAVMPVQAQAVMPVQAQAVMPVQAQAFMPVQAQAMAPVQAQAVMPVQAQAVAPAQTVMVQQAMPAQALIPQQMAPAQAVTSMCPPCPLRTLTLQEAEEICRQLQQYKAATGQK